MRVCGKCLIPETAESITFDEKGVCNVCRAAEVKQNIDWKTRKNLLGELIETHRGKGTWDCIVPFSGWKDSVFTLHYLVKEYGIKPLVVTFDHGLFRPEHIQRQYRIIKSIGADWIRVSLNWKVQRILMLIAFKRKTDFCWPCHIGCFSVPAQVALEKKIPLTFFGEPSSEYTAYASYSEIEKRDEVMLNRFINLGYNAEDMALITDLDIRELSPLVFPPKKSLDEIGYLPVCLGSFIPWDTQKQTDIIKKEIGWKGDIVEGAPSDFDKVECMAQGSRDFCKFAKRGFGRTAHQVSLELRRNRMKKEEARELIDIYDGKRPASLDFMLKVLGISEDEFMKILEEQVIDPYVFQKGYSIGEELSSMKTWKEWFP